MGSLRSWATPLTIGAFLLLAVTGVLMFFHLDTGLNKVAHEWLSWALVGGALAHLYANWPAFKGHLKRPLAVTIMAVFAAVLALSFVPVGGGGSPMRAMAQSIAATPIATLAVVVRTTPEALVAKLAAEGVAVRDINVDSLSSLASGDRGKEHELIERVFEK